jgi:hypothetical protein
MDWSAVNSALLTLTVVLLAWIRGDLHRVIRRVDEHIDSHP